MTTILDTGVDYLGELLELRAEKIQKVFGKDADEIIRSLPSVVRVVASNPFLLAGIDVAARKLIQSRTDLGPGARNALVSVTDAFLDRVKTLGQNPSEHQVKEAVNTGLSNARKKLDEALNSAPGAARLTWPGLCAKLPLDWVNNLVEWDVAMKQHSPAQRQRWMKLREKLVAAYDFDAAKNFMVRFLPIGRGVNDLETFSDTRLDYAAGILGEESSLVEMATEALQGKVMPEMANIETGVRRVGSELRQAAERLEKETATIRRRHNR